MNHVVVFGSINVDLMVRVHRLPGAGETALASSTARLGGGKGANQALAIARLGLPVSLVGAVGADAEGKLALSALEGVDVSHVATVDAPTGLALITVDAHGENTIIVMAGANDLAPPPDAADTLVAQLELPLASVTAAISAATGLVILNAAPAVPLPDALLGSVDVVVVNEAEATSVTGRPTVEESIDLLRRGTRRGAIVTLGARGCLVGTADEVLMVHARPAAVVDTVGAGDAFVGALTWGLLEGKPLRDAAEIACVAGALAVTRAGARSSPTLGELRRELLREPDRGS